jgi:hypothetical protein
VVKPMTKSGPVEPEKSFLRSVNDSLRVTLAEYLERAEAVEEQRDMLLAVARKALYIIDKEYGAGILNGYWPDIAPVWRELEKAVTTANKDSGSPTNAAPQAPAVTGNALSEQPAVAAPLWDHELVRVVDEQQWITETLHEHSEEGWELVAVAHVEGPSVYLYFKRPQ